MALRCYDRFYNASFYPAKKQELLWIAHKDRQPASEVSVDSADGTK